MKSGIKEIDILLGSMNAELRDENYVFFTTNSHIPDDSILKMNPIAFFREREGMSYVVEKKEADQLGIAYDAVYSLISLTVHSSLDAVGLTSAVAGKLASENISANVVAAYYHDHIFVQREKAKQALNAIKELQTQHKIKESE